MSNSENELGKKVLVHQVSVVAIIDPLLLDLGFHLCLAVEGSQHSVDSAE